MGALLFLAATEAAWQTHLRHASLPAFSAFCQPRRSLLPGIDVNFYLTDQPSLLPHIVLPAWACFTFVSTKCIIRKLHVVLSYLVMGIPKLLKYRVNFCVP